jgi:hypothetical protein
MGWLKRFINVVVVIKHNILKSLKMLIKSSIDKDKLQIKLYPKIPAIHNTK